MARRIVFALVVVGVLFIGLVLAAGYGTFGQTDGAGVIEGDTRPSEVQRSIEQAVQQARREADLHVSDRIHVVLELQDEWLSAASMNPPPAVPTTASPVPWRRGGRSPGCRAPVPWCVMT